MKYTVLKLLIALMAGLVSLPAMVEAQPDKISYQAKLTDEKNMPLKGSFAITFSIYDSNEKGNLLWTTMFSDLSITTSFA